MIEVEGGYKGKHIAGILLVGGFGCSFLIEMKGDKEREIMFVWMKEGRYL